MSPITKKLISSISNNKHIDSVLNLSLSPLVPIRSASFSGSCSNMSSTTYNELDGGSSPSSTSSSMQDSLSQHGGNSMMSLDMSSNSSGGKRQYGRVNRIILDKNSEEYRKRRERNNMAVKKSRNKSKVRTEQTLKRVAELKAENERLETKVKILSKELSFLKDLFLAHAGSSHTNQSLSEVLFNGSHDAAVAAVAVNASVQQQQQPQPYQQLQHQQLNMSTNGLSSPINSNIISSTGTSLMSNIYDTGLNKMHDDGSNKVTYHHSSATEEDESSNSTHDNWNGSRHKRVLTSILSMQTK